MKPQFENYSKVMIEFSALLQEFAEKITDQKARKASAKLLQLWNKVVFQHNEFEKLVEPIAPVAVKMPFPDNEFREMWITFKEYLLEDHHSFMGSRRETVLLGKLKKLSDNNQKVAIDILEFIIANGYKNIFKPTTKQLTGEEPVKVEDASSVDVTKKTDMV